jgi:lipoyl(octanoyl) transferase
MLLGPATHGTAVTAERVLQAYLLGSVEFEAALALQRRLLYHVTGDRDAAALILCEHPPLITVGRQGSWTQIRCEPQELHNRRWCVRWVNRGGPCLLHLPGQMAIYPILALDRFGLGVQAYLERLQQVVIDLLDDFQIRASAVCPEPAGNGTPGIGERAVWVGNRPIAGLGIAVRDWVTYYGAWLNVNPDLEPFRLVRSSRPGDGPITSLERERRGPLRPALVRERFLEHFAARFAFAQTALFFDHPSLSRKAPSDALTASP